MCGWSPQWTEERLRSIRCRILPRPQITPGPSPREGRGRRNSLFVELARSGQILHRSPLLGHGPRVTASVTERFRVADKFNYPTQLSSIDRDRRVVTFSPAMFVTSVISGREM